MSAPVQKRRRRQTKANDRVARELVQHDDVARRAAAFCFVAGIPFEERYQTARIGVMNGLKTYDARRSANKEGWLYGQAFFAVKTLARKEARFRRVQTRFDELFDAPGGLTPLETLERRETEAAREALFQRLRVALEELDPRLRSIVTRVCCYGERQEAVAASLGISQSWCSRLNARALRALKIKLDGAMIET